MDRETPINPRFDEYLAKIESLERARRRRRLFLLLPALAVGSTAMFFWPDSDTPLSSTLPPIVSVHNPDKAQDLISNHAVWDFELATPVPSTEALTTTPAKAAEQQRWFTVDISGKRQAGEGLLFSIENYDNEFRYTIDFDNGVVRSMKESISYRYPLPGHFEMKLIAVSPEGDTTTYLKKYEILPR